HRRRNRKAPIRSLLHQEPVHRSRSRHRARNNQDRGVTEGCTMMEMPFQQTDRPIVNAMSVDVEDYFHVSAFDSVVSRAEWEAFDSRVVENTNRVLEVFDRSGVRATFFVLGCVAERFPSLVRQISDQGHEVASHGYHHQLVYMLTPRQFREDVRASKSVLEDAIGAPVFGFRAPSYSVIASSVWALDILIEEGFAYDASIFPIHHDRYGIPDAPRHAYRVERSSGTIVEMPASTVRLGGMNLPVAGGGYFRLL